MWRTSIPNLDVGWPLALYLYELYRILVDLHYSLVTQIE